MKKTKRNDWKISVIEEKTTHKRCPDCGVGSVLEADGVNHWYHKQDCKVALFLVFLNRYWMGKYIAPSVFSACKECMEDAFDVYEELVARLERKPHNHSQNKE